MKTKYDVSDASKVFLWAVLLPQILAFFMVLIFSIYFKQSELKDNIFYLICCALLFQITFFLIFVYYNKKNKIDGIEAIGIKTKISIKNIILSALIPLIAVAGLINFISLSNMMFTSWGFTESGLELPLNNFGWLILNVLFTCLAPAFMEELIFRGVIFRGLRKRGFLFACLISSLCFAIVHFSIFSLIYPIIMGIIFCLIVEKTGSIIYSMIAHFSNNLIITVINYINIVNGSEFGTINISSVLVGVIVCVVAIITFIVIIYTIKLFMDKNYTQNEVIDIEKMSDGKNINEEKNDTKKNVLSYNKENKMLIIAIACGTILWIFELILTRL